MKVLEWALSFFSIFPMFLVHYLNHLTTLAFKYHKTAAELSFRPKPFSVVNKVSVNIELVRHRESHRRREEYPYSFKVVHGCRPRISTWIPEYLLTLEISPLLLQKLSSYLGAKSTAKNRLVLKLLSIKYCIAPTSRTTCPNNQAFKYPKTRVMKTQD